MVENVKNIKNKDLKNGTYIINQPGIYKLVENIIFHPNSDNDFQPRDDQELIYPKHKGYVLGFFAAFVIESEDVIFDMCGHSIDCSKEFNLKQRFFSIIELASSPFIPKQGPANFGKSIIPAKNCVIQNGILGLTPHHGIHGNNMSYIYIKKILFRDYEVAGISLNGGTNIYIENCKLCGTSQNIQMLSTYSHCRFDLPFLEKIVKRDPTLLLKINNDQTCTVQKIYDDVVSEMKLFEDHVLYGTEYNGIFTNKTKLMDDNVYGIALNSMGVLVNDFKDLRDDKTIGNENIYLKNIIINNTISNASEIVGFFKKQDDITVQNSYGKDEFCGPVGDIFNIQNCIDKNGCYVSNIVGNMQLVVKKYGIGPNGQNLAGTSNFDDFILNEWLPLLDINMNELCVNGDFYYYVYGRDSMGHVMKGNIGLFISQGLNITVENIIIDGVINNGKSKGPNKNSSQSIGIGICGSKKINIKNKIIKNVISRNGDQEKIKIINLNEDISIY